MPIARRVAVVCLALCAVAATRDPREVPATRPIAAATAPATRPLTALLVGTYRGTVVDEGETVPCVTTFSEYCGQISGTYVVREGKDAYPGTLDDFKLLSDERRECRFHWRDRNGEGIVTVRVTAAGDRFEGSWGLEVVQDELVWTGTRETPKARRR